MNKLVKEGFRKEDITSYGNMFLLGDGHIGYRGTLEEFSSPEFVGINVAGFYDRYKKLWREPINVPNPFHILVKTNKEECNVLKNSPLLHRISLDIKRGLFSRLSEFKTLTIKSERFVSLSKANTIITKFEIKAKEEIDVEINIGFDPNIWEINGPHFKKAIYRVNKNGVSFVGTTNEKKVISEVVSYKISGFNKTKTKYGFICKCHLKSGEKRTIYAKSVIFENERNILVPTFSKKEYLLDKRSHSEIFKDRFENARVRIFGDKNAQDELDYSIYHLCILANPNNELSIAARGVSGQTYKGAIFWDTEIFLLPYYTLTYPQIARNCLMYRINNLKGAINNAKLHGYEGAFFPWESQEGNEMCSKYNVTDVFTGKPIRTYFNEKQIHTSADILLSLDRYIEVTGDTSILNNGGLNLMKECVKFYMSYGYLENGLYHFKDVIGPDEYHERVKDNAFTNFSIKKAALALLKYLPKTDDFFDEVNDFAQKIYIPQENESGIIEQFDGYFKLEDVNVETVKSRLKDPREYWGAKNGVATKTKVIKQADVVAMMALNKNDFSIETIKKNYDYYSYYTEHGSSLSASMYATCAVQIGYLDEAYKMFRKSSSIDLGINQKMFAGGIYIGGTHPASNAGSYNVVVYDFAGLEVAQNGIKFNPKLPKGWRKITFKYTYKNKKYFANITRKNVKVEEI